MKTHLLVFLALTALLLAAFAPAPSQPQVHLIAARTATPTPRASPQAQCRGALPSRLEVGGTGRVSPEPPISNRVRSRPEGEARLLGLLRPGETFRVLEGPRCAGGWAWWRVRSQSQDLEGWTSEGDGDSYWLEPYSPAAPAPLIGAPGSKGPLAASFRLQLTGNAWSSVLLGKSNHPWGYLVDVTPLEAGNDGDHVESYIQTWFDGKRWVDTLYVGLPHPTSSLDVQVDVYTTQGWRAAFRKKVTFPVGDSDELYLGASSQDGAYVLDVNPFYPSKASTAIVPASIVPEFSDGSWWDLQRLAFSGMTEPVTARLTAYQAPGEPIETFEMHLEPGDWQGIGLGPSSQEQAYVLEIDPLNPGQEGYRLEKAVVQPEFDGANWNDVLRVMVPQGQPALDVTVKVYVIKK